MNSSREPVTVTIEPHYAGQRLDQVMPQLFPEYSRSRLQEWIKAGQVTVDGEQWRPRDKVLGGERVELLARMEERLEDRPQEIPLELIYTDQDLLVINKPAGMVVHPAAGNPDGTMLNGLLYYDETLRNLPRAGIVHRLDRDTSGILVVARSLNAHRSLVEQLQAREIKREYRALVCGVLTAGGSIDQPIGRHPVNRIRMAVTPSGKEAITHYRVLERLRAHSYLRVNLESGRTHQIRVHMAHIHHPLLGDPLYGGRLRIPAGASDRVRGELQNFKRQALHARVLGLKHPTTGDWMEWEAEIPGDMQQLLDALREDAADG
jgi:23S rRNA pseudouridine1911/1915/1917 synthase